MNYKMSGCVCARDGLQCRFCITNDNTLSKAAIRSAIKKNERISRQNCERASGNDHKLCDLCGVKDGDNRIGDDVYVDDNGPYFNDDVIYAGRAVCIRAEVAARRKCIAAVLDAKNEFVALRDKRIDELKQIEQGLDGPSFRLHPANDNVFCQVIPDCTAMSVVVTIRVLATYYEHDGYCSGAEEESQRQDGYENKEIDIYYPDIAREYFDDQGILKERYYECSPVVDDISHYNNKMVGGCCRDLCGEHYYLLGVKLKKVVKVIR